MICGRCLYLVSLSVYGGGMSYGLPDSAEYNQRKFEEIKDSLEKLGPAHAIKDCPGLKAGRGRRK